MELINYGALSLHLTGEKGIIRSNRKPTHNKKAIEKLEYLIKLWTLEHPKVKPLIKGNSNIKR